MPGGRLYLDSQFEFDFLNRFGSVFLYRVKTTSAPQEILTTVNLWRGGVDLQTTAKRLKIAEGYGIDLELYSPFSGFASVDAWLEYVRRVNKYKSRAENERGVLWYLHEVRGHPAPL